MDYCFALLQRTRHLKCLMSSTLVSTVASVMAYYDSPHHLDMINMLRIGYVPSYCAWLYAGGAATAALAWSVNICQCCTFSIFITHSCEQSAAVVHVYDGNGGSSSELAALDSLHSSPLTFMEVVMCS